MALSNDDVEYSVCITPPKSLSTSRAANESVADATFVLVMNLIFSVLTFFGHIIICFIKHSLGTCNEYRNSKRFMYSQVLVYPKSDLTE